jgi:hypothetical protein
MGTRAKPLMIDLFAGLGGWAEGGLAEGWRVVGFDIERHVYGVLRYPAPLVIQDVLTLHGAQFRDAELIVASPPCQAYSYMAMPWSRAKRMAQEYLDGTRDRAQLTALFDACFRIQREACKAAGRHIPLVVENVCGAQQWVGRARWHYGSYYLWGDVPALMPIVRRGSQYVDGRKTAAHVRQCDGHSHTRHLTNPAEHSDLRDHAMKDGIKQHGSGRAWFADDGTISPLTSSGSPTRKAASAAIARIPLRLARHIARAWYPDHGEATEPRACHAD